MNGSQCKIRDLKFSEAITDADEAIIKDYCKFRLTGGTIIFILVFGGIGLYMLIAPWISSEAETTARILLSAFGAVLIGIMVLVLRNNKFNPEGIIYGTVDNAHSEKHRTNGKNHVRYYAHVTFERTNQEIPLMRVPPVNGKSVKSGTKIMIVKRDDDQYEIIYPEYCKIQKSYTSNGENDVRWMDFN